ncbi:RDD family protein [Janthinobacterium agaricidamnosum]|uniref:RDD family protein n=1 Tax=Janthinobacterium agaricidamnosum NBRC 102515 = DSM 9628 TaxID=1349767 RepID=W0V9Q8_9BURK|nr:RDD family protein [Janthinobacterium agaricidamnosum]CDG83987.1 RDD family protein [Janthinobacterium agaricidamnosum NBRC 102515 = DSM 9628]
MSNKQPGISITTPTIKRRLICIIYEALLVAAVVLLAAALFTLVTLNSKSPLAQHGMQCTMFLVSAAYFIHFWTDSGHTLAMKTWRIKVVMPGYATVPARAATIRFLLAWGWFLPALFICHALGKTSPAQLGMALAINIAAWAMTALLDKDRQFLHDKLAGTRLIQLPKPAKKI